MTNLFVTPSQEVQLFFHFKLLRPLKKEVQINIKFHEDLKLKNEKRTLAIGKPGSLFYRNANTIFKIRDDLLLKKKQKILPCLGEYDITTGGELIHREKITPIKIIDNKNYFEKETIPYILKKLQFIVCQIGGAREPDIISYYRNYKTQMIDIEPTHCIDYKLSDLDEDMGKYERYQRIYDLKRLLTICYAKSVSKEVINEINTTKKPASFIEYDNFWHLFKNTLINKQYDQSYIKLTTTGVINEINSGIQPQVFIPKKFTINRTI